MRGKSCARQARNTSDFAKQPNQPHFLLAFQVRKL